MTLEEIRKECESHEKRENIMFHVAIGLGCVLFILLGIYGYQKGMINLFLLIVNTIIWIFFFSILDKIVEY